MSHDSTRRAIQNVTAGPTDSAETSELPDDRPVRRSSLGSSATIEDALSLALERASAAGEWAVVAQLAKELEARRLAISNVAVLDPKKKGRQ